MITQSVYLFLYYFFQVMNIIPIFTRQGGIMIENVIIIIYLYNKMNFNTNISFN